MTKIIKRKDAKQRGLKRYFTGNPCAVAGHVSERATRNGECLECAKERLIAWRIANPEKQFLHRKRHAVLHRAKELQQHKDWLLAHPERCEELRLQKNQATAIWAKKNRDKRNSSSAKRRSAGLQRTLPWLNDGHHFEIECIYKYCAGLRSIGLNYHVDHIIPLQGSTVSGLHVPWNLQAIPATLNISKGNRLMETH